MTTRAKFRIAAYSIIAIPVLAAICRSHHILTASYWEVKIGMIISLGLTIYYGVKLRKESAEKIAMGGEEAQNEIDRKRKAKRRLIWIIELLFGIGI